MRALRDKMKYLRSQGKQKVETKSEKSTSEKKRSVMDYKQSPKSYEPQIPPGEDEHSFIRIRKCCNLKKRS